MAMLEFCFTSASDIVEYEFLEKEEYIVRVNVSNTISSEEMQLSVIIIQRIKNVLLTKLDPPPTAVATNDDQAARINVINNTVILI